MQTCAWCQTKHPSVDARGLCKACAEADRYPARPARKHAIVRLINDKDVTVLTGGQRHTFPVGEAFFYEE